MQEKEQEYAKTTFDKVANKYDEIPFFKISAKQVVSIIQAHTTEAELDVLDVACGTGNVVLECASSMNKANFDAMDISEGMLAKAEANAKETGVENVSFHCQDITKLETAKKYDVITCSYALFFLPEAHKVLQTLTGLLKTDAIVIFTSFLAEAFEPSSEILLTLLKKYGSNSAKEYDKDKWENLKHVKDIEHLCTLADVNIVELQTKKIRYGMDVDEWWELFNNTGYKGMLMELTEEDYERVKSEYYEAMFSHADMDGEVELVADSYFVGPKAGEKYIDFEATTLDGKVVALSDYLDKPIVLDTGSITCPMYANTQSPMNALQDEYPDVHFLLLYVREAHPVARTKGVKTIEEKMDNAKSTKEIYGEKREVLVDSVDGYAHKLYGAMPNMTYVIGTDGIVKFRANWTNIEALKKVLLHIDDDTIEEKSHYDVTKPPPLLAIKVLLLGGVRALYEFAVGLPQLLRQHAEADRIMDL